jgi:hypothetical protein
MIDKVSGRAIYAVIINAAGLFPDDHSQTPLYQNIFGELPSGIGFRITTSIDSEPT